MKRAYRYRLLGVLSVLVGLGSWVAPWPAHADDQPGCGAVITESVTLTADVGPCPGTGLKVDADNVTVDLGGHALLGVADHSDGRVGVIIPGHHGVTVQNGSVSGFTAGVAIVGGSGNTLTKLKIHDNIGPALRGPDFGDGVLIDGSADNAIVRNTIGPNNGPFDAVGVLNAGSDNNLIQGNSIVGNSIDGPLTPGGPSPFNWTPGIFVAPFAGLQTISNTRIIGNTVSRNGGNGIHLFAHTVETQVLNNVVEQNGFGAAAALNQGLNGLGGGEIGVFQGSASRRNTISGNQVHGNVDGGIVLAGSGPPSEFHGGDKIYNNDASNNLSQQGHPDLFDSFGFPNATPGQCGNDRWKGNTWGIYPGTQLGSFWPDCTSEGGSGPTPGYLSAAATSVSSAPASAMPDDSKPSPKRGK